MSIVKVLGGCALLATVTLLILGYLSFCTYPGSTRLAMAIDRGDVELVRQLVEKEDEDPNQKSDAGWTPLTLAVSHRRPEIVRILLDNGASVDRRKNSFLWARDGGTPLTFAASSGQADVVAMLIAAGAKPDLGDYKSKATPLMIAAGQGRTDIVRQLLAAGADLAAMNGGGATAFHYACGGGPSSTVETVRFLLERGADIEAMDVQRERPLHSAAATGNVEVIRILLAAGAHSDARTVQGDTALSVAATRGKVESIRELLPLYRNDPAVMADALADARREGHADVIRLLEAG